MRETPSVRAPEPGNASCWYNLLATRPEGVFFVPTVPRDPDALERAVVECLADGAETDVEREAAFYRQLLTRSWESMERVVGALGARRKTSPTCSSAATGSGDPQGRESRVGPVRHQDAGTGPREPHLGRERGGEGQHLLLHPARGRLEAAAYSGFRRSSSQRRGLLATYSRSCWREISSRMTCPQ